MTMSLPNSYSVKPKMFHDYFYSIYEVEVPDRFSVKFFEDLGFTSPNDRVFVSILKDLGFITVDNVPTKRYFACLDKENFPGELANGIREMYADLFSYRDDAYNMGREEVQKKLRSMYTSNKKDNIVSLITSNFIALCKLADFSVAKQSGKKENDNKTRMVVQRMRNAERIV